MVFGEIEYRKNIYAPSSIRQKMIEAAKNVVEMSFSCIWGVEEPISD